MSETMTLPMLKPKERIGTKRQAPYNVVLLNDDDHSLPRFADHLDADDLARRPRDALEGQARETVGDAPRGAP